jgi:predicted Rossmann-fold nucleotide-binding protein
MNAERLPLAAVIGSGKEGHSEISRPLGKWLAENGFHLINGGGGGVMAETARGFVEVETRKGKVIGVIPSQAPCDSAKGRASYLSPTGYPNAYTEIVLRTHLPDSGINGKKISSRNHIIVLSADVVIALPGGPGTRSEIELAL